MITLYHFGANYGLPDASPFCLKVDTYLRVAGIDYTSNAGFENLRHSPKGKLPYIEDDGKIIADSTFIIDHLKEKYGDNLDKELNPEQRATAHAFIKMMEENLYWCMVYSRWIDEQAWPAIKKDYFGHLPFPLKIIIPTLARKGIKKSLFFHGLGRHSGEEILAIAKKDLTALSNQLGSNEYFLINKPTTLDVVAFAFLSEFILPEYKSNFNESARSFDNLVKFVKHMKRKYYSAS